MYLGICVKGACVMVGWREVSSGREARDDRSGAYTVTNGMWLVLK